MAAEYIDILRTELERQRQFLSEEEEQVLLKPARYESDDDLALDSVKRRQHSFVPSSATVSSAMVGRWSGGGTFCLKRSGCRRTAR